MAKTDIMDLGSSVCVDDQDEKYIPALGDGAGIPGDLCSVITGTGKIQLSTIGALEFFSGILMESKITGTETAIPDGTPCRLVVPKSGHGYRINIVAAGDTDEIGTGVTFSTTAGKAETTDTTLILSQIGRISLEVLTGDTVCELNWIE